MAQHANILDRPILSLSDTDHLRLRDLVEGGTLITGGLGSGKSSTSGKQLISGLMRAGLGGVIHTVKGEDTENVLAYAKECRREQDVIVFNEASKLTFDPLAYEWSRPGRGAGDVENIIEYFSTLLAASSSHQGASTEKFWELAAAQAMRHAIHLIKLAQQPLSIVISTGPSGRFRRGPANTKKEAGSSVRSPRRSSTRSAPARKHCQRRTGRTWR
jgi:hypothetical protein